jgi:High potential iron-sulfur protein
MQSQQRRVFMLKAVAGATGLAAPVSVWADATAVPVKETDAYPKSMGFKLDTKNVDKAKFPRHEASQKCSECQLFSGKAGEALGPCSFFKRMVPPDGWCRNFKQRKAGA